MNWLYSKKFSLHRLLTVIEEYQRTWMITNYPEGLETSLYTLTTTLQRFIPDSSRLITGSLSSSAGSTNLYNGFKHDRSASLHQSNI